ncbi:MAG: transcriptional regulator PadR family protein [Streptosporangiaceae bacterium]|jgi:PadR family transcriptional regulator AphA|nr:transcriptional regulator PadR family protein [Streptosporangiaceae bacterium]
MIAMRGPSTSYDLKRAIGRSVGYFWSFPHAQLYSEPKRLQEAGLLELHEEDFGRRRKTYSITELGDAALRRWLGEPVNEHFELRDVAEIKLFFNELTRDEDIARLAAGQVAQHEGRIAEYERMLERYGQIPEVARRMITLELGLAMEHAALDFWHSIRQRAGEGEFPGPSAGTAPDGRRPTG